MTLANDPIVIVSAVRTPMGGLQGDLKSLSAPRLGAAAIRAAVERAGIQGDSVEQVLFGCVLPAGLGQAPARQAALGAGPRLVDRGARRDLGIRRDVTVHIASYRTGVVAQRGVETQPQPVCGVGPLGPQVVGRGHHDHAVDRAFGHQVGRKR